MDYNSSIKNSHKIPVDEQIVIYNVSRIWCQAVIIVFIVRKLRIPSISQMWDEKAQNVQRKGDLIFILIDFVGSEKKSGFFGKDLSDKRNIGFSTNTLISQITSIEIYDIRYQ